MPKVSVVIPTYNRAHCICRTIDSVLAQTFQDLEIIVVDDGSTDGTRDALQPYLQAHGGRVRYFYQENQERRVARNNGIARSLGEYVAFLDSDDVWMPDKLQSQVLILDQYPQVGLVYGQMFPIDPDGTWHFRPTKFTGWGEPGPAQIFDRLVMRNLIPTPTVVVRKPCFERVGNFDSSLTCSEDWDLWLRISMFYDIVFIRQPLAGATFYEDIPARRAAYRSEENRIRILTRLFDDLPDHLNHLAYLKPLALARRYLDAAYLAYARGMLARAQTYFSTAIGLDPALLADEDQFVWDLVDHAVYFAGASGTSRDVVPFIDRVLSNLPPTAQGLSRLRSRALAHAYLVDAFERYALGDLADVRRDALRAVAYDLRAVKNRGLMSIFLESILGRRTMDWVRNSRRRRMGGQRATAGVSG